MWGEISKLREKQHTLANQQAEYKGQTEVMAIMREEVNAGQRIAVLETNLTHLEKQIAEEATRTRWVIGLLVTLALPIISAIISVIMIKMVGGKP